MKADAFMFVSLAGLERGGERDMLTSAIYLSVFECDDVLRRSLKRESHSLDVDAAAPPPTARRRAATAP